MQRGAAGRGAGRPGMPPMGPGGMPDLSKLTPGQMAQMQVRFPTALYRRSRADLCVPPQNMLPAGLREQMAQPGAMQQMQQMMQSMGGGGGGGGFPGLGGGGMPDMSKLMGMFGGGGAR